MILCGGLGTRLGALTAQTPKPLLKVGDAPFLAILIQELTRYGVDRILLLAGFRAELIQTFADEVASTLGRPVEIEVSVEPVQAGTGGALVHARGRLDETFYLCNGDSFLDMPLTGLARLLSDPAALAALALRAVDNGSRYGVVELNGERITRFGARGQSDSPAFINGGVYLMRRELVDRLAAVSSLEQDLFPRLAEEGSLRGRVVEGFFIDIGVPEDFARAQTEIPAHRRRPALFLDLDVILEAIPAAGEASIAWKPGAAEAIAGANRMGWYVFLVSDPQTPGLHQLWPRLLDGLAVHGAWMDDRFRGPASFGEPEESPPGRFLTETVRELTTRWPVDTEHSVLVAGPRLDTEDLGTTGPKRLNAQGRDLNEFFRDALRNGAGATTN